MWYFLGEINKKNSEQLEKKHFIIQQGESSEDISKRLEKEGLIRSSIFFNIYAWKNRSDSKLIAGEYDIPQNLSIREILKILNSKRVKDQVKITTIE